MLDGISVRIRLQLCDALLQIVILVKSVAQLGEWLVCCDGEVGEEFLYFLCQILTPFYLVELTARGTFVGLTKLVVLIVLVSYRCYCLKRSLCSRHREFREEVAHLDAEFGILLVCHLACYPYLCLECLVSVELFGKLVEGIIRALTVTYTIFL